MRFLLPVLILLHAGAAAAEPSASAEAGPASAAAAPEAQSPSAASPPAAADAPEAATPAAPATASTPAPATPSGATTGAAPPDSATPPAVAPAAPGAASDQAKDTGDEERWYSLSKGKKLGLGIDLGAPDGGGLTVLFRPWWWLRLNGGFAYNVIGAGIRGGLSLAPVQWGVTPTLSFDFGHYFSGDVNKFVTTSNPFEQALLSSAAYNFWSLQAGLEFGSQQSFVFYLRGGIAHISAQLSGQDVTNYIQSNTGGTDRQVWGDLNFNALIPCISLGFLIFVY